MTTARLIATQLFLQSDDLMSGVSLGAQDEVYIHDKGDFDTSIEKSIMVSAAKLSQ